MFWKRANNPAIGLPGKKGKERMVNKIGAGRDNLRKDVRLKFLTRYKKKTGVIARACGLINRAMEKKTDERIRFFWIK